MPLRSVFRYCGIVLILLAFPTTLLAQNLLLSQTELAPYGLKRVWFHQLKLRSAGGKIQHVLLEGGQLFLVTSDAKLHVLDSETGQWLWTRSIGTHAHPLTEPAVNSRIVAVHNNLAIYLFHRQTGKQLLQIPLSESASAGCEMSEHYLYVPLANQTLHGYILQEAHSPKPEIAEEVQNARNQTAKDPELAKIVAQFEEAKRLVRLAEPPKTESDEFVLDSTHRIPITCAAFGNLRTKPLLLSQFFTWKRDEDDNPTHEINQATHQEFLSWVTEQGFLYTARTATLSERDMTMLYQVDSAGQTFHMNQMRVAPIDRPGNKSLPVRPACSQPYPINEPSFDKMIVPDVVITGGHAAYVFAIGGRTGDVRWQFPAQGQLLEAIAVIGRDVYAPTATGGFHALDLETGKERWFTRGVKRFLAASRSRVYVLDQRNRLVCLDRASGATLFVYDIRRFDHFHFNVETDQLFLFTNSGLVQCLRERQFAEDAAVSLRHRISSREFAETVQGADMPTLWWLEETGDQE